MTLHFKNSDLWICRLPVALLHLKSIYNVLFSCAISNKHMWDFVIYIFILQYKNMIRFKDKHDAFRPRKKKNTVHNYIYCKCSNIWKNSPNLGIQKSIIISTLFTTRVKSWGEQSVWKLQLCKARSDVATCYKHKEHFSEFNDHFRTVWVMRQKRSSALSQRVRCVWSELSENYACFQHSLNIGPLMSTVCILY